MRERARATLIALITTLGLLVSAMPAHAVAAPPKVVIIVGPTGPVTDSYRSQADDTAAAAAAAGADVVKVYSPNATWANVKAAVDGASVIVYYGHGNGFPSPYSTTLSPWKVDGWGLNRTTTNGDGDSWSSTMVYCGEAALTGGALPAGTDQATYCGGGPITPAPGWVMVYANACYAPGASEPGQPAATPDQARDRAANFSRPVLGDLGASAYFATDIGAAPLVADILTRTDIPYGDVYSARLPGTMTASRQAHPLVSGDELWLGVGSTAGSYTFAFAGDPTRTFAGGSAPVGDAPAADATSPEVTSLSPTPSSTGRSMLLRVRVGFSEPVTRISTGTIILWDTTTWTPVPARVWLRSDKLVAFLQPSQPLEPKRRYALRVSAYITDLAGNHLSYTSMLFTTTRSQTFDPQRRLDFQAGTYVGYKFTSTGAVAAKRSYTLSRASGAPTSRRSAIAGHSGGWYYVTAGVWAGYWLKEGTGITFK